MGGFFGVASKEDCMLDVFFGTDYHSHLGTRRGGLAAYDRELGLQREIHNIENSPFRTKFENIFDEMKGTSAIGCISDWDPQPLLIRSKLGTYAICIVGRINNTEELIDRFFNESGGHFDAMTGGKINSTELVAALINQRDTFAEGIRFAQESIEGTASILILKGDGHIIAARDKVGRLPVLIGKSEEGYCVSFESFAYKKLGYDDEKELGPGEIVELTADSMIQLAPPGDELKICASSGRITDTRLPTTKESMWKSCATATAVSWPGTTWKAARPTALIMCAAYLIQALLTPLDMPTKAIYSLPDLSSNTLRLGPGVSCPPARKSVTRWPR